MKATELLKAIEKAIEKYGDINVGQIDGEFSTYNPCRFVTVRRPTSCDEDELGETFIGLSPWPDPEGRELEVVAPSVEGPAIKWTACAERMPTQDEGYDGYFWGWDENHPDDPPSIYELSAKGFCHEAIGGCPWVTHWMPADPPKAPTAGTTGSNKEVE